MQISALVPEIFKFEKWVKHAIEITDDITHSTQYYIEYINSKSYLGQFAAQTTETWWANSSTGNTLVAIKNSIPMATHSFPVPTHLVSIC